MPKKYAKHGRNKRKPTARQQKFIKELAKGKTTRRKLQETQATATRIPSSPAIRPWHNCADVCRSCWNDMASAKKF